MSEHDRLEINRRLFVPLTEIELTPIHASGPGGQNVNKVSSAIHLRFDIEASSLPESIKEKLRELHDHRITREHVIVIKAQEHRSQEQNREAALARLAALIRDAVKVEKARRPTRPTRSSQRRRMDAKTRRGRIKDLRRKPPVS